MRVILFRGKEKGNPTIWRTGSLVTLPYGRAKIVSWDDHKMRFDEWEVIPETVGQFTGVPDRNLVAVFEGDIVRSVYTKRLYAVCFGEYTCTDGWGDMETVLGWYNTESDGDETAFGSPDAWAVVVGNIHDNPELLKVGEQS